MSQPSRPDSLVPDAVEAHKNQARIDEEPYSGGMPPAKRLKRHKRLIKGAPKRRPSRLEEQRAIQQAILQSIRQAQALGYRITEII